MKDLTTKKILIIFTASILIFVPFIKNLGLYLYGYGIIKYVDSVNPAIVIYISLPFLIFVYIRDILDKKRKLDMFDYLFYTLAIVSFISTFFSINKYISVFGSSARNEGLLVILSYYLIFINWKVNGTNEDIKRFLKFLIILAILNSIYALFQIYTNLGFILKYNDNGKMASGLCGNPNFFGSLIVTVLSIVTLKFLFKNEKITFASIITIILLFISLINSNSTGPILTYIIFLILVILFLSIKKYISIKKILVLFIILVITYTSVFFVNKFEKSNKRCETCVSSIKETIKSGGTGRLKIWENSLNIVKKYPVTGVGFDNFYLVYPNNKKNSIILSITNNEIEKKESKVLIYDNAHNVYLHILVSTGILGLIPYLLLCLLTFIKGIKLKNNLYLLLLAGFVSYSIQAFTNISVIQVAPIYYIIIGLILSKDEPQKTSYIY